MTGLDIIKRAMKLAGALMAGETPTDDEAQDCLTHLNDLLDSWSAQSLTLFAQRRNAFNLTTDTQAYTIGAGGTFNIVRPLWVLSAKVIQDRNATTPIEIPCEVLTVEQWAAIPVKSTKSTFPYSLWYDHAWSAGLGTISVYPIPDNGTAQLVLYTPTPHTAFADLAVTDYTFPPGYAEALRYNLAKRLFVEFGRQADPLVVQMADETLAFVKRANERPALARCGPEFIAIGRRKAGFDWRSGSIR